MAVMRVVFVINEGTRTGIAAINFTGNNSISAWYAEVGHPHARNRAG